MRGWMLVGFFLVMGSCIAGQEEVPKGLDALEPDLVKLRSGEWSEERAKAVIGGLVQQDRIAAAGWWLDEAGRAIASKRLPRATRKSILTLGKQLRERGKALDPQAYKLTDAMARHARDVVSRKNLAEAETAIAAARTQLAFFPTQRARDDLIKATRRLDKAKSRTNRGGRVLEKQRAKTQELSEASTRLLDGRWRDFVRDYQAFGTKRAYRPVRDLVARAGPAGERKSILAELRATTLTFAEPAPLKIWVIGSRELHILVNGEKVAEQAPSLPPEHVSGDSFYKVIETRVLPGDLVVFHFRMERPQPLTVPYVTIHAQLAGKTVPRTCYLAVDPAHPMQLGPAGFGVIEDAANIPEARGLSGRGPAFPAAPAERDGGAKTPRNFSIIRDPVIQWFKRHGLSFICVRGTVERWTPAILVPDDQD